MSFAVEGAYGGEDAILGWDGVQVDGWPDDAVAAAESALEQARIEGRVLVTPTGPSYDPASNEGVLLVLLSVLDVGAREAVGDAPQIPQEEDELF